jgi:hypothetical protein
MHTSVGCFARILGFCVLASGCQKSSPPTPRGSAELMPPPLPPPTPAAEARHIFDTRCVVCHGSVGNGDGPGGAVLNPKPRAFGDATWQKSVDDAHIAKAIVEGGLGRIAFIAPLIS